MSGDGTLLQFDLSVPSVVYGKQADDHKSRKYYFQVTAKLANKESRDGSKIELQDTAHRSFEDFHQLHLGLESIFPNIKLPAFPSESKKVAAGSAEDEPPAYVTQRRIAFDKYIKELKSIEVIRDSYEFQRFLPRICHLLEKSKFKGLNIVAKEVVGFLSSNDVKINVNTQLKLLRIMSLKNASQKGALARANIFFKDILNWSESVEKGKYRFVLHFLDGSQREFIFNTASDVQILSQLLSEMKRSKELRHSNSPLSSSFRDYNHRVSAASHDPTKVFRKFSGARKRELKDVNVSLKNIDYKIYVGTWNLARTNQESFAHKFFPDKGKNYDIIAIGFQECSKFEGKSRGADVRIAEHLQEHLKEEFFIISRKAIWEISIVVFARKALISSISAIDCQSIATGFLGVVGNKGAVAVGMKIMNTSICFLVSHLAAHQHQTIQRNLMVQDIVNRLKIGDAVSYLTHHYDAIIWFGDLNYRINFTSDVVIAKTQLGDWEYLASKDQLRNEMSRNHVFSDFKEWRVSFPPTYKLNSISHDVKKNDTLENDEYNDSDDSESSFSEDSAFKEKNDYENLINDSDGNLEDLQWNNDSNRERRYAQSKERAGKDLDVKTHKKGAKSQYESKSQEISNAASAAILDSKIQTCEMNLKRDAWPYPRSYDSKRIPAWTDRILYRNNKIRAGTSENILTPLAYDIGLGAKESDHYPVYGIFNFSAQSIPPSTCYLEHSLCYMSSLSFSFDKKNPEVSKIFQGVEEIFVHFHGTSLSIPTSTFPKPLSSFYAEEISDEHEKEEIFQNSSDPSLHQLELVWDDLDIPSIQIVTNVVEMLSSMRIMVSLCRVDSARIGDRESILSQSQIHLSPIIEEDFWPFESPLCYRGVNVGTLSGKIYLDLKN